MANLNVIYRVAMDISGLSAGVDAVARSTDRLGRQMTAAGTALTKTLTLPILGLGVASAKAAIDFESSFAGVRKTVNATETEFAQMAQGFRDLAKTIPVNVNELNRLGEAAGALGIPKAEVVDFARVMALLGVTTNVTSDQAAESIAKIQNIFGAAGKDTERFASTLVALGNDGASTEDQILSMATRISGAGNVIGLTQGEVLGFASALASVGLEAEAGGTAISRVFIEMASAVNKGGKEVANFAKVAGQPVEEFSRLFKEDAAQAVESFVVGLGNIKESGGDLLGTLAQLGFSEIRVRDTLLRAAGAGDLLTRALNLQENAWRDNSALTIEAGKRFETTASQMTLLWNRVKDIGITIGIALLPMIQATVKALDMLLPIITTVAQAFSALPTPVQAMGIGLLALVAAAGPALFVMGQLALSAAAIAKLFTTQGVATVALRGSMSGLTATLGLLGPAIGVVATAFLSWKIGRLIGEVTGLDAAIDKYIFSAERLALQTQTTLAAQDSINLAIQRGAAKTITYTDAIKFNDEWLRKRLATLKNSAAAEQRTVGATQALTDKFDGLSKQLASANKDIADLSESARTKLVTEIQSGAVTMTELQDATGLSAAALKLFEDRLKTSAEATTKATEDAKKYREEQEKIAATVNLAFFNEQVRADLLKLSLAKVENATVGLTAENFRLRDASGKLDTEWKTNLIPGASDVSDRLRDIEDAAVATAKDLTRLGQTVTDTGNKVKKTFAEGFAFGSELTDTIIGALQGGGNVIASVAAKLGQQMATQIATSFKASFSGSGAAAGVIASAVGLGYGAIAAYVIAGLQLPTAKKQAADLLAELEGVAGGMDALRTQATALGFDLDAILSRGPGEWGGRGHARELNDLRKLAEAMGLVLAEAATELETLNTLMDTAGSQATDTAKKMTGLRAVTPELKAALEGVYNAKTPQEYAEAIGLVNREVDEALLKQAELDQSIRDLGLDFKKLPAALRAQKLGKEFQDVKDDIDNVTEAGVTMADAIRGGGPELSRLVQEAKRTGTEIPEALRPVLQQAIGLGVLVDGNGKKIQSLEGFGVHFGTTFTESLLEVKDAMLEVVDVLKDIKDALLGIPSQRTIRINVIEKLTKAGITIEEKEKATQESQPKTKPESAATGGFVTARGIQRFATGGVVLPWPMQPRGTDTVPIMATPGEVIFNQSQQDAIADRLAAAGGSSRPITIDNRIILDGQEMKRWQREAVIQDAADNVSGFRTRAREALGIA